MVRRIFHSPGLASRRWLPLSSNVRPQGTAWPGPPRPSGAASGHVAFSGRQEDANSFSAPYRPQRSLVKRRPVVLVFHRGLMGGLKPARSGQLPQCQFVGQPRSGCARSGYSAGCRVGIIPNLSRQQACSFSLRPQESGPLPLPSHASPMPQLRSNPSFKRSANGRPPGPRGGAVYHPPRVPG